MSIRNEINARVAAGQLFPLPPLLPSSAAVRHLLVSVEVLRAAEAAGWSKTPHPHRHQRLRADFDRFTEGKIITVAEDPRNKKATAFLARVMPLADEVWDIRSVDPKPGIRVLGRFSERDTFIALCWDYRENLRGARDWSLLVDRCLQEWKTLFNTEPAHRGSNLNAYLTNFLAV